VEVAAWTDREGSGGDDDEGALVGIERSGETIEGGAAHHESVAGGSVAEVAELGGDAPWQAAGAPDGATAVGGGDEDGMLKGLGGGHGEGDGILLAVNFRVYLPSKGSHDLKSASSLGIVVVLPDWRRCWRNLLGNQLRGPLSARSTFVWVISPLGFPWLWPMGLWCRISED
jgi:hypothetical protein